MLVFVTRRTLQSLAVIFAMSLAMFLAVFAIGDPVFLLAHPNATEAELDAVRRNFGLDQPLWQQYIHFMVQALHGNLGKSFFYGTDAITLIIQRLPATIELTLAALLISILFGIPLGLMAGVKPRSTGSRTMGFSIVAFGLPSFWLGLMLILLFSVELEMFPATGRGDTREVLGIPVSLLTMDGLSHVVLPAVTLSLYNVALLIRLTRASTREVILQDYIKFARAKGIPMRRIIGVHVLKNTMIPTVTVLGLEIGSLLTGSIITESIFSWPGMGKLIIDSIHVLDRPVIVAFMMVTVTVVIVVNLAVDLLYSVLDPRVNLARATAR